MYCSKCGAELKEEAVFCPVCGTTVGQPAAKSESTGALNKEVTVNRQKKSVIELVKKNKIAVAAIIALVLAAIFCVTPFGRMMLLDKETRYAVQAAQEIQSRLLDPESMVVREAYTEIETDGDEDDPVAKCVIYLTAANYGGGVSDAYYLCYIYADGSISCFNEDSYRKQWSTLSEEIRGVAGIGYGFDWTTDDGSEWFAVTIRNGIAGSKRVSANKVNKFL